MLLLFCEGNLQILERASHQQTRQEEWTTYVFPDTRLNILSFSQPLLSAKHSWGFCSDRRWRRCQRQEYQKTLLPVKAKLHDKTNLQLMRVSSCGLYSLITGYLCTSFQTKEAKSPTASLISLCRKVKRPPFLHTNACPRVNGDWQPSQNLAKRSSFS